jgi:transcriptional regulator with XRE-family HTH domain
MGVNATSDSGALRQLRRTAGLTQQQVAFKADCSLSYIRLLEQGFLPEHSDVLPRVLRALELPHDEERPGHHPEALQKGSHDAPTAAQG